MPAEVRPKPRTPAQVRQELQRTRDELQASVNELRDQVFGATDWRRHYRRHPAVWLGVAVAIGFYLGFRH